MKKKIVSGLLAMATVMSMSGFMIPAQAADGDALEVWVRNSYYDEMVEASKAFTEKTGIQVNVTEPSNMSDDLHNPYNEHAESKAQYEPYLH